MVSGVDLIKEQIYIAAGLPLDLTQEEITLRGHALECRINAEDPKKNFMPCPGKLGQIHLPGGFGVRVDTASYGGCEISPYYDSMAAKVIVHDRTRQGAIQKMRSALGELVLEGITTNLDFSVSDSDDEDLSLEILDTL